MSTVFYVAPARERGLKLKMESLGLLSYSRSREGAWIEIWRSLSRSLSSTVAPARERGLK